MSGYDIFVFVCMAIQVFAIAMTIYHLVKIRKYKKETAKIIEDINKGKY